METYEVDQAAEILEELLDRADAGEIIGITRGGKLVARLLVPDAAAMDPPPFKCRISSAPHWRMTDSPTPPKPRARRLKAVGIAFVPVPSQRKRHDGWAPARQRDFLVALHATGVVATAARSVGMSGRSAY